MFLEEDLIPISGLQHFAFCPRQCALIYVEKVWTDNRLSAEGLLFHKRVHEARDGLEDGRLVVRGMRIASRRLGLYGVADVVEFVPSSEGAALEGLQGLWQPVPVEYKRGRSKKNNEDRIQLCAQAACLEEHYHLCIRSGFLFYGQTRRRERVEFSDELRRETEITAGAFRKLVEDGVTPLPETAARCHHCSLREVCMPNVTKEAEKYISRMIRADSGEEK
jgi:CRISPR-associated exonuclease Cas4